MTEAPIHARDHSTRSSFIYLSSGWLFVLSTCSYLSIYFGLQDKSSGVAHSPVHGSQAGADRRRLHAQCLRAAVLIYAILVRLGSVGVVAIMVFESDSTHFPGHFFVAAS